MNWRCEWCGKPHEENDPPCDNCGHGKFEEAVVQQAGAGDGQDSMLVWVCTECGREHTKNSPPCSRCNNATFERREKVVTDADLTDGPTTERVGSVEQESMTVWVCSECGKEHTKNTPPCDRCGSANLDRETKTISEDELEIPGYLDLLTPQYAAVLGVVLLIAVVFGLGAAGVVDLPFFPDNSVPEVENVPGNETEVSGISLSAVESEYVQSVNTQREANGLSPVERNQRLNDIVAFDLRQRVKATFGDDERRDGEVRDLVSNECRIWIPATVSATVTGDDTAASLGDELAGQLETGSFEPEEGSIESVGIATHALDNEVFLNQIICLS